MQPSFYDEVCAKAHENKETTRDYYCKAIASSTSQILNCSNRYLQSHCQMSARIIKEIVNQIATPIARILLPLSNNLFRSKTSERVSERVRCVRLRPWYHTAVKSKEEQEVAC